MLFGGPYSDSSGSEEEETVGDCRATIDDSDGELDESEDPLKHAGAYTAEEITLITRDKLIQLQSLHAEYLQVLKRRYGRKRAEFRKRVKAERDTYCSLAVSASTARQKIKLDQLNAARRYHRHFGQEALLFRQSQKRRRLASGTLNQSDKESVHLCNALVNGMDCGEVALPNSSMCSKHVLCDGKQVLFFKCEVDDCRNVCIPAGDIKLCWFHQKPPIGIKRDLNFAWVVAGQSKCVTGGVSSIQQRSSASISASTSASTSASVFTSSASQQLRVFPPPPDSSSSSASGGVIQQKQSVVNARYTRKRDGSGNGTGSGATPAAGEKTTPSSAGGVIRGGGTLQPPPPLLAPPTTPALSTAELRSAPPIPANKMPSIDDVSAEAGVYGAYMRSNSGGSESAETGAGSGTAASGSAGAGQENKPAAGTSAGQS